jgi:predicted amidohydrolase
MNVAVAQGRIAHVAASIPSRDSATTVDAAGLYVTPGRTDLHVHV